MQPEVRNDSPDSYRAALYRVTLFSAGCYNLAFGVWASLWPRAFFTWFRLDPPRYPGIWQCLGMVIGLYGIGYWYAARYLDRARPWVAIGLAGKLFGPAGWLWSVQTAELPDRTFSLIVFNDLVWWVPFGAILCEGSGVFRRLRSAPPWVCAALHAAGALALATFLRPGTEVTSHVPSRAAYIAANLTAWRAGWLIWMAAGASTVVFYAWWGAHTASRAGVVGTFIAAVGVLFDYSAESLYVGWLPHDPEWVSGVAMLRSGCVANGLYVLGGIVLTVATPGLRGWLGFWTWSMWVVGVGVSVAAICRSVPGLVGSTGMLFVLYCPWCVVFGRWLSTVRDDCRAD